MLNDKEHKQVYDSYIRALNDCPTAQFVIDTLYKASIDSDITDSELKSFILYAHRLIRFDFLKK